MTTYTKYLNPAHIAFAMNRAFPGCRHSGGWLNISLGSGKRVYEVLVGIHFATTGSGNTEQSKAEKG